MGGIGPTPERLKQYTVSVPYHHAVMLFVIPKGVPYTSFEKLFFPFDDNIWILISTSFLIGFIFCIYLRIKMSILRQFIVGREPATPFLNMFNIFFGGPVIEIPNYFTAKTIVTIWMVSCLILRSAYQGRLFNMLQSDMTQPTLNSLSKLTNSKLFIYTTVMFHDQIYINIPQMRDR